MPESMQLNDSGILKRQTTKQWPRFWRTSYNSTRIQASCCFQLWTVKKDSNTSQRRLLFNLAMSLTTTNNALTVTCIKRIQLTVHQHKSCLWWTPILTTRVLTRISTALSDIKPHCNNAKSTHKTLKFKHEETMDNVCTSDCCAHFQWYALNSLSCKCSVNQPTCILVSCR